MATIKITELTSIGANLTSSTVIPVVNMSGTPTTEKTLLGNIANVVLAGAGGNYTAAAISILAQSVTNAAQPNITSVGTLTNVAVSGNATVNGNITSNGTAYLGNISTTGIATITTLAVGTTANLGAVGNVTITGGTAGQVLSTNGNGVLSWASDATSYGNSNVANYLPTFTGNIGANVVTANLFSGNGTNLTNIAGANVSGFVPNANVANTAFSVAAANVSGLGNIATTNYDGNASNVLHGDGSWSADTTTYGNSNVVTLLSAFGSNTITTTGNVSVGNITATNLGNISNINLDGNVSNLLTGNGTYVAIPVVPTVGNIATINLDGNSQTWLAGNGVFANIAIPSVGNIATLNLDGNASNVLRGDGTFGADANSSYGDSNVTSLLGAFGSNTISTTGIITADGANLSNVPYANLTGAPSLGNISNINLDGNVSNLLTGNGTYVAIPVVPTVGNIATINLTGSNSNVLYGNGTFAAVPAPTVSQDITSNGAMSIMLYDGNIKYNNYATVEPSSGNIAGGNISANGNISGGNISATGNITANNLGNISSINIDGSNSNVLYGNGVFAAVAGGNANTGNVTFDDNIVIGTGDEFGGDGLFLAPGNGSIANSAVQYLRVRGGDFPTHIHLDTGNNQYYDQYFGADGRYVKLEANGNVVINADDYLGNSATWTLTIDGNLILAGGNSVIQSIANSSLDPTLPNVSTMTLTPDANYNSQVLVLDPTAPGHIHLRAYAFSNIDEPAANIFLGGEDTAFEVTSGANNQAVIHSNGKAWTFGNDGNISSDTLTFTTTFANVKTVEYQTAGVWDLYVEDSITGSNTAISRLNVSFKDNLIDKPQVYIENTKESDGIALRWTFDENGNLNFPRDVAGNSDPYLNIFGGSTPTIQSTDASLAGPANLAIQSDYLNLSGSTGNRIILQADAGAIATDAAMVLSTNLADPGNIVSWTLDTTGNLYLPDTTSVIANVSITFEANDSGNITGLSVIGDANANLYAHGNVTIVSDSSNTNATWAFGADGNLTLPGNTFAVNYANGTQVSIGGGGNTGNVTFNDINIIGTGNLKLQPDSANANAYLDIYLTGGPDIHIAGNGETVILGTDDYANVAVNIDGNVSIQAGNVGGTQTWNFGTDGNITLPQGSQISETANTSVNITANANTWAFGVNGNLTLPGNLVIAGNTSVFGTNASLLQPTDNLPLIALSSGANGAVSSIWVEDVANVGTSNIAAVYANPTVGSGIVRIAVGQNGGNTGPNLWDFGTTGILTLPQGSQISETANTSVNITANANTWAFGVDGNLTVPGSIINDTSIVLSAPAIFNICTIATAGSGYNTGSSLKATTGGSGTGMTVGIGYGLSNQLTSVNVVNPGTGYVNGDVITVSEGTGGTFVLTKYNVLANQTNNNTVQTDLIFANNTLTIPVDGNLVGNLIVPGSIVSSGASPAPYISGFSSVSALQFKNGNSNVTVNANSNLWTFDSTGNLTIPGSSGGFIKTVSNASIGIAAVDNGTDNPAQLLSINAGSGAATSIVSAYATNATIQTNATGAINTWKFDNAGNLTLPANAFAINYANGTQVSLGGGNVTWAQIEDKDGNSGPTIITLGQNAGFDGQGNAAIAIGLNAGAGGQGESAITIGQDAGGNTTQGANAVAIGRSAGFDAQGEYSVAIGQSAGSNTQGLQSVAVGLNAGSNTQGNLAVGIGVSAGFTNQGDAAVAIGPSAGYSTQSNEAVAIGAFAGETTQGTSAVAIGSGAGRTSQGNNSIILNATGANLNQTTANTFTVSPVRNDTSNIAEVMFYNATSKEVTYGNTISVAGNITGGNIIGNGNTLSNVATKTSGSWTLASGVNTVNISVPLNGTYAIWVNGNIPNGIITYTATAVVTNTNVPVLGEQYGWYYALGNALVLTSIPDQFVGTVGSISTVNTYAGNTANVFTFGITNNSGNTAVVNYGYTKL